MTQNVLNCMKQKRLHRNYNYDKGNSTLEGYSTDTGQSTQFIAFKHLSLLQNSFNFTQKASYRENMRFLKLNQNSCKILAIKVLFKDRGGE